MLKEYIKNNILICDGAMGTYYSELTGNDASYCEFANINKSELVKKIHCDYINAGSKLIRTNTFSANTHDLGVSKGELKSIIEAGVDLAREAVNDREIFIGASIGPIRHENVEEDNYDILEEYKFIVDCFLDKGINIFIFETFSNYYYLKEISEYIKFKSKDSFVLTQFAFKPDGYTRDGFSVNNIIEKIKMISSIDSYGLNCGSGPAHLYDIVKHLDIQKNDIVSVLPNAGFPEIIHERTVYPNNPIYFAKRIADISAMGVKILGGCCGTSPSYIREIIKQLNEKPIPTVRQPIKLKRYTNEIIKEKNTFKNKLKNNKFVIAVELTAPVDTDISKILKSARICKENNIDLVTVPDSPMSKVRADSIIMAAKIKREIGIEAMPHICCRDKNTNAIRSSLMGAHIENIRNALAITGDPISDASKVETKSVFNLNSFRLIELIKNMNKEVFNGDDIFIGGALNPNVRNKEVEYKRMMKKVEQGADFFLTQPVYDEDAVEFIRSIKERSDVKILAGILPVVSYRNAMFLNNELPGVTIPKHIISRFTEDMTREEAQEVGVEIAVEIGKRLKGICDGLYFVVPFSRVEMIMEIIRRIND